MNEKKYTNEIYEDYASFPENFGKEIDLITKEVPKLPKKDKKKYRTNSAHVEPYKVFPENEEELVPSTPYKKVA